MKILAAIVAPPHLSVSGAVRAAEQLSFALPARCDVTIASMMRQPAVEPAGSSPRRLPVRTWLPPALPWSRLPRRYSTLFYRSELPRLVASGDYDLVHLHNPTPALELERIAQACVARGIPYVVSTHGFNEVANGVAIYGFDRMRAALWQRFAIDPVRRVVRGAAAIFALSEADTPILNGMGYAGPITPVPNGVPLRAEPDMAADRNILEQLGIPPEKDPEQITFMFLANHTPNKGLPDLLAAVGRLTCPFRLIIGGEQRGGIDYEGALRHCRKGQEILLTGRLTDAQVGALFRRSDLFVFPTLGDTFPLVVLEAMSHGVPVLATRIGGIPHQIDPSCGVLVESGDVAALAAEMTKYAAAPGQLAPLGERARQRVASSFTWERAAESALAGYERVLTRHRLTLSAAGRRPGKLSEAAIAQ